MQRNKFSGFPTELKLYAFSFFSTKDLCNAALVCSSWQDLSNDDLLWKKKLREEFYCDAPYGVNRKQYYISLSKQLSVEKKLIQKHCQAMNSFFTPHLEKGSKLSVLECEKLYNDQENVNALVLISRQQFLVKIADLISDIQKEWQNESIAETCGHLFPIKLDAETVPLLEYCATLCAMCNCDTSLALKLFCHEQKEFFEINSDINYFLVLSATRLHIQSFKVLLHVNNKLRNDLVCVTAGSKPVNILGATINSAFCVAQTSENKLELLEIAEEIIELALQHGMDPDESMEYDKHSARETCLEYIDILRNLKAENPDPDAYEVASGGLTLQIGDKLAEIIGLIAHAPIKEEKNDIEIEVELPKFGL